MRAVVLERVGQPLAVVERPVPRLEPGEELVRVLACGVCHSDLHLADGTIPTRLPLVLGHEVVGHHAELGHVLVYAPWGCRRPDCPQCASGQEMVCGNSGEAGLVVDGGYADYLRVPDRRYLLPLGDLDVVRAAPLACGGLTAYRAVKRTLPHLTSPGARVAVVGAGGLGQFAVQFLALLSGAEVTAVDLAADKLSACRRLGADVAVRPEELSGPYDAVIDFVGSDSSLRGAVAALARQGLLVLVGLFGGRVPFGLGAVPSEAMLTSSIWGSLADLTELLALVARSPMQHLVEAVPLEDAQAAHDRLRRGEVAGRLVLTTS